jgi:hypothetical protein
MTDSKMPRDTSKDTNYVWFDPERGYIFRGTEPAPEAYVPNNAATHSYPSPNPVTALAYVAGMRPTNTSKEEWHRLAKAAIKEYDRVCGENYQLREKIKNIGPKFQGMTELA